MRHELTGRSNIQGKQATFGILARDRAANRIADVGRRGNGRPGKKRRPGDDADARHAPITKRVAKQRQMEFSRWRHQHAGGKWLLR